jgi:hypothetical protein
MRSTPALLFCAVATALAADPDAIALLRRVLARVGDNTVHLQNYTCVETISREYYRPAGPLRNRPCSWLLAQRAHPQPDMKLQLASADRLRLDVAVTNSGEMFSWAGAGQFDDRSVDRMIGGGPIGTGAFGAFLTVVFGTDAKTFVSHGLNLIDGRQFMEYTFAVSKSDSHYSIQLINGYSAQTAYSGTALVDPETGDPVHLLIETAELPEDSGTCRTTTYLDYTRVTIGGHELLLPQHARERFVFLDGRETENTTTFASCREFSSESTVKYYQDPDPNALADPAPASAPPPRIATGLQFSLKLNAPIDIDTAAAGDLFTATLASDLRQGRYLVARKGTLVEGRITSVKVSYGRKPEAVIGLSPRHIEIAGVRIPLAAVPDVRARPPARTSRSRVPAPADSRPAVFRRSGAHITFAAGFTSQWITVAGPLPR